MYIRKIVLLIITLSLFSANVYAAGFADVPEESPCYKAVTFLSEKGIINGYEDGTFKPDSYITRAEAAALIVRTAELEAVSTISGYYDVPAEHWAAKNIKAATDAGIINGMGNGVFMPEGQVTYMQIIKMAVCMLGEENFAAMCGGWPDGYLQVAFSVDLIDINFYDYIQGGGRKDAPATRGDVFRILYNAYLLRESHSINVSGEKYTLKMDSKYLESPDEKIAAAGG